MIGAETTAEKIQMEIIRTIRDLEGFWNVYRDASHGIAGYLKFLDEQFYVEFIFSKDPQTPFKYFGAPELLPLFKNFFTAQRQLGAALRIKEFMNGIIRTFEKHRDDQEKTMIDEFELIKKHYRVKKIDEKNYNVLVILNLGRTYTLTILFQDYPNPPTIEFDEKLIKEVGPFDSLGFFRNWNKGDPPHIAYVIKNVEAILLEKISATREDGMFIAENLQLTLKEKALGPLTFRFFLGESLGVYCLNNKLIWGLLKFLAGNDSFSGNMRIFGQPASTRTQRSAILESSVISESIERTELASYLEKNFAISDKKSRADLLAKVLQACGLINQKNLKLKDLTKGQELRFNIALNILKGKDILIFSNPGLGMNTTEIKKFWDCVNNVTDIFQISVIIHSNEESLRLCDRILMLDEKGTQIGFGTLMELFQSFPLGEHDPIIVVQVRKMRAMRDERDLIEALSQIPGLLLIIEERRDEKYHLFFKEKHEEKIQFIYNQLGSDLFSLSKASPTLFDYLRYIQHQKLRESQ